jgi:hypothetical protein
MVPGFEFLQDMVRSAGAAVPGMGQWIAPTLDPAELDKRIGELRTVQFWLEQNARMLATTIQALEVQRMTLSTLQTMNLPLSELGEALRIKTPAAPPAPPPPSAPAAKAAAPAPAAATRDAAPPAAAAGAPAGQGGAGLVDPMQWWGALTQQFSEIASRAMKDSGDDAARRPEPAAAASSRAGAKRAPAKKAAARKRAAAPRPRSG